MLEIAAILHAKGCDVVTIDPDALVLLAVHELASWDIGMLVVTKNSRDVLGLISERELTRGLLRHGCQLPSLRVRDVMARTVATCRPAESVTACLATMTRSRQRYLPVVGEHGLCGVISAGDLARYRPGDRVETTDDDPSRTKRRGDEPEAAVSGSVR